MIILQLECPIDGLPLNKTSAIAIHPNEKPEDFLAHQEKHINYVLDSTPATCLNGHIWQVKA